MSLIKFPALVISAVYIDKINYRHFVASKKYLHAGYKNVTIVDSKGNCYLVSGIEQCGGVSIMDSIANFGCMVKVKPILKEPARKIELTDLKKKIIDLVNKEPYRFSDLLDRSELTKVIGEKYEILDLINVF